MKKILAVALMTTIILLAGCGSKKSAPIASPINTITRAEAQTKLLTLSEGLEIYHDDMKGFTLCRCHYDVDERVAIIPYVVIYDENFSVSLRHHVLYCGRDPLHFDTLYIKTPDNVRHFKYNNVSILYGHCVVEEYNGTMSDEVFEALREAVASGYAKIRLEGQQMDERELKKGELDGFKKVFAIYEFFKGVKVEK